MSTSIDHELVKRACTRWQGGRDGGSSRLRGAARVNTGIRQYFDASYIRDQEEAAREESGVLAEGEGLLAAVDSAERLTADGWNLLMGLEPRGFAGRGLEAKNDQGEDEQILAELQQGLITMPLWGVSLSPEVARGFGNDDLRWVFEVVGEFPAVAAWHVSGIKPEEEELTAGVASRSTASGAR